jgi:hypothetical protein
MLNLSLFEFMLQLRSNPRMLARFFPDLAGKVLEPEPRNLSRELKGTPMEMTDFVVVYGFGDPLSHVVAVSFQDNLNPFAEPAWAADHANLVKMFGLTPIVLALATEDAIEKMEKLPLAMQTPRATPQGYRVGPRRGGGSDKPN